MYLKCHTHARQICRVTHRYRDVVGEMQTSIQWRRSLMCFSVGLRRLFWGLFDKSGFSQQISSMLLFSPPNGPCLFVRGCGLRQLSLFSSNEPKNPWAPRCFRTPSRVETRCGREPPRTPKWIKPGTSHRKTCDHLFAHFSCVYSQGPPESPTWASGSQEHVASMRRGSRWMSVFAF